MTRLFDRHADGIVRLGRALCDRPANAEDLVQETFLRALRSWDRFEGRSAETTWLYAIAVRACRRMERRRAGEPRGFARLDARADRPVSPSLAAGPGDDPARVAEGNELRTRVRGAVAALDPTFRMPLVLKELEGLTVAEVARVLGLPVATVKTRLHRGRLKLARVLAEPRAGVHDEDVIRDAGCADLLTARLDALDRDVPFPLAESVLCERCRETFRVWAGVRDVCAGLAAGAVDRDRMARIRSGLAARSGPRSVPPDL